MSNILMVDDDIDIINLTKQYLEKSKTGNFAIFTATNTKKADQVLLSTTIDVIILDVMMPCENGISYTKNLRDRAIQTPIIILSALSQDIDRIKGLQAGANDYLNKPFNPKELELRLSELINRQTKATAQKQTIHINGEFFIGPFGKVRLTEQENKIISSLIANYPNPLSREQIGKIINVMNFRTIDVAVTRARKKISSTININTTTDDVQINCISAVRHVGYAWIWPEYST
jgi:two-component system phosphate regulon response regulator OmpR